MKNNEAATIATMRHNVGVSDMRISNVPGESIVTHSLGSCIGVAIYDPVAMIGGILHFQLPTAGDNIEKAQQNPFMYADTGIPAFFRAAYNLGASKQRLVVKVAGGSNISDRNGFFNIGHRNYVAMKKIFWKNGVLLASEDIGGHSWRTLYLDIGSGRTWLKTDSGEYEL